MMTALETGQGARRERALPPGKVQCFISKQIVDVADTVAFEFNGVRVHILRKYVAHRTDPAPVP